LFVLAVELIPQEWTCGENVPAPPLQKKREWFEIIGGPCDGSHTPFIQHDITYASHNREHRYYFNGRKYIYCGCIKVERNQHGKTC